MRVNSFFSTRSAGCEDKLNRAPHVALRRSASNIALRLQNNLGGGFGLEEAAEARARELDADQAFAGFGVADVHNATLGGEICFLFFAAGAELRLWNANFEVGTDGDVKTGDKRRAASA